MMRRIGKQILTIALVTLAFGTGGASAQGVGANVVTSIVTDAFTGVAISGYDPVSYFTEPEPVLGSPQFELVWSGVPWYFANEANRTAFEAAPHVYAPQFGGHGTMSLARGYLSDGNPRLYLVTARRLYLFYSVGNREAFALDPRTAIEAAQKHWAELSPRLLTR